VRFLIEFLRIGNWRLADIPTAQIFGAGFVVLGVAMLVIRRRQNAPILAPAEIDDDARPTAALDEDEEWAALAPNPGEDENASAADTEPHHTEPQPPR
jgi:hypothetical protein